MGAKYWEVGSPTALKKCSERISNSCNPAETDGCCAVIPCTYCLELDIYGDPVQYGRAPFAETGWEGLIGSRSFRGFWERNYDTNECEFVVQFGGVEVYRKSCYEGPSCRDASDEATVTVNYETGTLRWAKQEFRPLEYRIDDVTGCKVLYCGDCECTCEVLCATVLDADGVTVLGRGELPDTAYPCDPPLWSGTVAGYDFALSLGYDNYGNCVIQPRVYGEEQETVSAPGCKQLTATIPLDNYKTLVVRCKECDCDLQECDVCDCEFTLPQACLLGTEKTGTNPCAGPVVSGLHGVLPSVVAWVAGEDTPYATRWEGFHITIPCGLTPLALRSVIVRRAQNPSGPSPYVDNDIVLPCEYYFVLYNAAETAYTIHYGYELCCGRSEAVPTCQTRLGWIRFTDVPAGLGVYDFLYWSHSGSIFYPDGFQGVGVLEGECPFSDGVNPCL